jgi:hypothetical protein
MADNEWFAMEAPLKAQTATLAALSLLLLPLAPAQASAAAKRPARAYDFDGNGRQDIVVGAPQNGKIAIAYAGVKRRQLLDVANLGAYASADLDKDGYADLAVNQVGGVHVVFGSTKGLGKRTLRLPTGGGKVVAGSVRAADFDADGRMDLVATAGGAYWIFDAPAAKGASGGARHDGTGEPAYPGPRPRDTWNAPSTFLPAVGDFSGDGRPDVALIPVGGGWSGSEQCSVDAPLGFASDGGGFTWTKRLVGTPTIATTGDFNGDGRADLALGAFTECEADGPHKVEIIYGARQGLGRSVSFDEDTPGVPGKKYFETGDDFGAELAAGDVNGDGRADLAVGNPTDVEVAKGKVVLRPSVTVFLGSRKGLTTKGVRRITEATAGIPGTTGHKPGFGAGLWFGDLSGDKRPELVIGVPGRAVVYTLPNRGKKLRTTGVGVLRPAAFHATLTAFGRFLPSAPSFQISPFS